MASNPFQAHQPSPKHDRLNGVGTQIKAERLLCHKGSHITPWFSTIYFNYRPNLRLEEGPGLGLERGPGLPTPKDGIGDPFTYGVK